MKSPRGYIAVASALIVSAILLVAVFTESSGIFFARFGQLDEENKERSLTLAFSCLYQALYAYAEDSTFAPNHEVLDIGNRENGTPENCTVDSITSSAQTLTLIVHSNMDSAYTAFSAEVKVSPLSITHWQEITSIPP